MTASHTVSPSRSLDQISNHGVLFLYGFGVRLHVRRGHLCAEWGIGEERYKIALPRVIRNLRRVVVIDSDGFATFDAIRWITEIGASMTFLDRRGKLLFVSGPTAPLACAAPNISQLQMDLGLKSLVHRSTRNYWGRNE